MLENQSKMLHDKGVQIALFVDYLVYHPHLKANKPATDPGSYRPILLTFVLCKIMKRLVTNRLQWWMENKGIFNKFQSGVRKNRSCEDHILRLQDEVRNKHSTLACFLDLEKAFDTMWIQGLLYKMQQIGLKGQIYSWIRDF